MSDLKGWMNPLVPADTRVQIADGEIERLNSRLRYEQHRAGRIGTHGPGCETWGTGSFDAERAPSELGRCRRTGCRFRLRPSNSLKERRDEA